MVLRLIPNISHKSRLLCGLFTASWMLLHGSVQADRADPTLDLQPFQVVGSKENLHFSLGSGSFLDVSDLLIHQYDSIEQVLRKVPGVYFRTEDGFGLFPNISFRGVGSMRTTKLTVMEDGILSAPAPYANPAAYYTPTSGRMNGVELLKGSSQVQYGPHTTGGVLNYLSTPIPETASGRIRLSYGSNNDIRFHSYYADHVSGHYGTLSVLLELYSRSNDGFKTIDTSPTFSGGNTGFRKIEPMLKVAWTPNTTLTQSLEVKVGYTDMVANETYLGLSSDDYANQPLRRYVSTQFDRIPTEQWRSYLRHSLNWSRDLSLVSTLYYNDFSRAWYKLHDVRNMDGAVASLSEALARSPFYVGSTMVEGSEGQPLEVLRGEAAGIWRVRDNNRAYKSYGIQSVLNWRVNTGPVEHAFEFGIRLHEDYEDRFQKQDDYEVDASGNVVGITMRQSGTQDNRRGIARALALHARDSLSWENWTFAPGVRYEHVRYTDRRRGTNPAQADFNQVTRETEGTLHVFAPGLSVLYDLDANWVLFGGVHRGFSLPGPSAAVNPSAPATNESSVGSEAGVRYRNDRGLRGELVVFHTRFEDLIVPDNIGGAGTGQTENAGAVRSYGVEASLQYDPAAMRLLTFRTPLHLAFTWTDATIRSDVNASGTSGGAVESIFAGGSFGSRLPYIPRFQVAAGAAFVRDALGVHLDAYYVPASYASANNSSLEINPVAGGADQARPDARFGRNEASLTIDLSLRYQLRDNLTLSLSVQNLLDDQALASRLPHGPRPAHPRFTSVGMQMEF